MEPEEAPPTPVPPPRAITPAPPISIVDIATSMIEKWTTDIKHLQGKIDIYRGQIEGVRKLIEALQREAAARAPMVEPHEDRSTPEQ